MRGAKDLTEGGVSKYGCLWLCVRIQTNLPNQPFRDSLLYNKIEYIDMKKLKYNVVFVEKIIKNWSKIDVCMPILTRRQL